MKKKELAAHMDKVAMTIAAADLMAIPKRGSDIGKVPTQDELCFLKQGLMTGLAYSSVILDGTLPVTTAKEAAACLIGAALADLEQKEGDDD